MQNYAHHRNTALLTSSAFASAQTPGNPPKAPSPPASPKTSPLTTRSPTSASNPRPSRLANSLLLGLLPSNPTQPRKNSTAKSSSPSPSNPPSPPKAVGDANRLFYHRTFEIPTTRSQTHPLHQGLIASSPSTANNSPPTPAATHNRPRHHRRPQTRRPPGTLRLRLRPHRRRHPAPRQTSQSSPGGIW